MVQHLPNTYEALGLSPSAEKKKKDSKGQYLKIGNCSSQYLCLKIKIIIINLMTLDTYPWTQDVSGILLFNYFIPSVYLKYHYLSSFEYAIIFFISPA